MLEIILVFVLGLVASFLSNISGGGGYFILLPSLLHLGVNPLTAVGTIKFGGFGMMLGSSASAKNKKLVRKDSLKVLIILTVISAIVGPRLAFLPSDEAVKIISSGLIVFTALVALASLKVEAKVKKPVKWQKNLGYGLFFVISTVLAGFGSGVGLLITYVVIGLLGMSPLEAISTRRFLGMIGLPIQVVVFIGNGSVDIKLGLVLLAGTALGGFLGLNFAFKKGNEFVKKAMAIVAIVLVISLFV